jgi:hypothetical protein
VPGFGVVIIVVMFAAEAVSLLDGDTDSSVAKVRDVVVGESKRESSLVVVLFKVVVSVFAFETVPLLGDIDSSGAIGMGVVAGESKGGSSFMR